MAGRKEVVVRARAADQREVKSSSPDVMAYVRPWLAVPALVPAGYLTHWLWGDAGLATGLASAAIAAAGGTVTYVTHRLTTARTWYAHHIATTMTGMATTWLMLATAFGPGRPLLDVLIIGGAATAAISDVHLWARGQGEGEATEKKAFPSWEQVTEKLHIRGVRMRVTKESDAQVKGRLEFADGKTVEDLQTRRKELASAYQVAPGAVRITEHPERADWGEITIITRNVMRELIPWPGLDPALVGASIADAPVGPLGVYEDGEPFSDELDDRHTLTVGMSGSGKSVYGKVKLVSIAARRDTFVCAIDMSKGQQTLGPVANAIGWGAYARKDAKAMLKAIERAATARANYLGSKNLPGWTPDCGLAFLHIVIEEAADLVDFDELVKLGRMARSAGIHLEISLQRATYSNLDTDARANFGDSISFGVKNESDASFALPEYVLEAGANPAHWQASQPGSAYAAVRHAPTERHTTPVKMFGPPTTKKEDENNDLKPAADSLPPQDGKLDPITREAFGKAYAEYLAGVERPTDEETTTVTAVAVEDEDQEETVTADVEPIELETPDDDPDVIAGIDDPIEFPQGAKDIPLAPRKGTQESAEEARAALDALFQVWRDQGITEFRAPDVGTALREQGIERKRAWVYKQLRRLEEDGVIRHDDDGGWSIVERELAGV